MAVNRNIQALSHGIFTYYFFFLHQHTRQFHPS